ncbi:hypothetical protein CIPAW_01G266600 [Carya illinoinensis]|uniref:Shugoshin C-terminal domain-containing protein n=1 Tax=Carya illinoinensis TaxID=32201 RepID=A0A8T1RRE6_CARIL|nr:hypothetical protein CIPAW_01G266600 [Carya illinoinensis]
MDGDIILDLENCVAGDGNAKGMVKGPKIGSAPRKRLADITNLQQQQQLKAVNQDVKQLTISLTTKEYIEKLRKENMTLMKLLVERNKIIELSVIELQKLRINLLKVQQQNLQLAQANSQMLAELNSGKDRLKALQHELGCKNGLLKARKLDLEVGTTKRDEAGELSQADRRDTKPCHTNRRRQSKRQSLAPTTVNQVHAKETVEIKSRNLRRRSTRLKTEEPEPTEDMFEIDDASGPTSLRPVHPKENIGNKRHCLRRQSARFKSEEPEQAEDLFEIEDAKFPVSPVVDDLVHDIGRTRSGLFEAQQMRRSSVGRPLRRAAEKVQSYKETPINVKMRRQE